MGPTGRSHEPRKVVLGQPLTQRRRHQQQLLTITLDEVLSHAQKCLKGALSGWCFGPIPGHIGPEDPLNQANAGSSPSMSCRAKSGRLRRVDKVLLGGSSE